MDIFISFADHQKWQMLKNLILRIFFGKNKIQNACPFKLSETHYKINFLHETKVVKSLMHSFFKSIKVQKSEAPGRYVSNYISKKKDLENSFL